MQTTKVAAVVALALLAAMLAVGVAWAAPNDRTQRLAPRPSCRR